MTRELPFRSYKQRNIAKFDSLSPFPKQLFQKFQSLEFTIEVLSKFHSKQEFLQHQYIALKTSILE